jgi:hypothetical protein
LINIYKTRYKYFKYGIIYAQNWGIHELYTPLCPNTNNVNETWALIYHYFQQTPMGLFLLGVTSHYTMQGKLFRSYLLAITIFAVTTVYYILKYFMFGFKDALLSVYWLRIMNVTILFAQIKVWMLFFLNKYFKLL